MIYLVNILHNWGITKVIDKCSLKFEVTNLIEIDKKGKLANINKVDALVNNKKRE